MTCISTISTQTRLDVTELLSHFSHFLDHNQGKCWAELFTVNGVFEYNQGHILHGREELATLPARLNELGNGDWRHVITAVTIERTNRQKELMIGAYCPVMDLNQANPLTAFFDLKFTLQFTASWRISHLLATRVGKAVNPYFGTALAAEPAPATAPISLQ